jgi:hypothetical protein
MYAWRARRGFKSELLMASIDSARREGGMVVG